MSESSPWYEHSTRVRFQDVDAAGIVFFARIFELFHDAYVEGLRVRGVDLARVLAEGSWGAPLTRAEARFRRPMRFGDALRVQLWGTLSDRELTVRYRVVQHGAPDVELASGETVHAFVDRERFARRPVPDEVISAFAREAT
jgi:1,4-dihydroxy-2-naphthoyl-CoA hydrolase